MAQKNEGKNVREYMEERKAAGDELSLQELHYLHFLSENGWTIDEDGFKTLLRCKYGRYDNWEFY